MERCVENEIKPEQMHGNAGLKEEITEESQCTLGWSAAQASYLHLEPWSNDVLCSRHIQVTAVKANKTLGLIKKDMKGHKRPQHQKTFAFHPR